MMTAIRNIGTINIKTIVAILGNSMNTPSIRSTQKTDVTVAVEHMKSDV